MSSTVTRDVAAPTLGRKQRRLTRRKMALIAAGLAVLAAGGWYGRAWWTEGRFIESTDDAYVGGNITAIAPHVGGFIQAVLVRDNQLVHAGDVLIRLDPRDYRQALDRAEAVLAGKAAALESLRAQVVQQQSVIQQDAADLAAKTAQAEFAATDADRYRSLAGTSAGSRQDMQRSNALNVQARSAVLSAAAGLQGARQRLVVLGADITEADAAVAQAKADAAIGRLNLGYTEVRSPIDGYIGNRAAQVGAYASTAAYLLSVIPQTGLWVDANFKEDQLAEIKPGRVASVVADTLPGHRFRGHVVSLAPGTGAVFSVIPPENATGNFTKIVQRVPVRIAIDDGDPEARLLRPGLSTTVGVDTRTAASAP